MTHMRYAVPLRKHIQIRILKPCVKVYRVVLYFLFFIFYIVLYRIVSKHN
jgi:hypothetical protein